MKTVCFFGIYDPDYSRNRVLIEGFRENGWRVLECRANPRQYQGLSKYRELYRQYRCVRSERLDLVIVAFPGHTVMSLARLLFGRRIVFDAFLSLYDSNVLDRRVHPAQSIIGGLDWLYDWTSVRLATTVLLDTDAHIEYFVRAYGIKKEKCVRVFVGTDALFTPSEAPEDPSLVHFHGTYIPLQGVDTILAAAELLKGTTARVRLVGRGQERERLEAFAHERGLANVEFADQVPLAELPAAIAPAAVCLGIFGSTEKASRVIPNKLYECIAMGKAVVTADTPAVRELEAFGELPLVLVPSADPAALASAVRGLLADPARRAALGRSARALYETHLTPRAIVRDLLAGLPTGVWRSRGRRVYS